MFPNYMQKVKKIFFLVFIKCGETYLNVKGVIIFIATSPSYLNKVKPCFV